MSSGPDLLPGWARYVWVGAFLVVLVVHVRHMVAHGGRHRGWHATHTLMALGMTYMFLPAGAKVPADLPGQGVFAAATVAMLGWVATQLARGQAVNLLWGLSLVGQAAMVYMFAMPELKIAALTWLLVAWFTAEAVIWVTGGFDDGGRQRRVLPYTVGPRGTAAQARVVPLAGAGDVEVRLTLGVAALGMAYMFVVMQIGM